MNFCFHILNSKCHTILLRCISNKYPILKNVFDGIVRNLFAVENDLDMK